MPHTPPNSIHAHICHMFTHITHYTCIHHTYTLYMLSHAHTHRHTTYARTHTRYHMHTQHTPSDTHAHTMCAHITCMHTQTYHTCI